MHIVNWGIVTLRYNANYIICPTKILANFRSIVFWLELQRIFQHTVWHVWA